MYNIGNMHSSLKRRFNFLKLFDYNKHDNKTGFGSPRLEIINGNIISYYTSSVVDVFCNSQQ